MVKDDLYLKSLEKRVKEIDKRLKELENLRFKHEYLALEKRMRKSRLKAKSKLRNLKGDVRYGI